MGFKTGAFGVLTCRGVSPSDLETGFLNPFTGGAETGGSLMLSIGYLKKKGR